MKVPSDWANISSTDYQSVPVVSHIICRDSRVSRLNPVDINLLICWRHYPNDMQPVARNNSVCNCSWVKRYSVFIAIESQTIERAKLDDAIVRNGSIRV